MYKRHRGSGIRLWNELFGYERGSQSISKLKLPESFKLSGSFTVLPAYP